MSNAVERNDESITTFAVSEAGTLRVIDFEAPKTRAEIYWLDMSALKAPAGLEMLTGFELFARYAATVGTRTD